MNKAFFGILLLAIFGFAVSQNTYCHFNTKRECNERSDCFYRTNRCYDRAPRNTHGEIVGFNEIVHLCRLSEPQDGICPSFCKLGQLNKRTNEIDTCVPDLKALRRLQ